jgi:hypothetical protein
MSLARLRLGLLCSVACLFPACSLCRNAFSRAGQGCRECGCDLRVLSALAVCATCDCEKDEVCQYKETDQKYSPGDALHKVPTRVEKWMEINCTVPISF